MWGKRKLNGWKNDNHEDFIDIISQDGCATTAEHNMNRETNYGSKKQVKELTNKLIELGYFDQCKEKYEKENRAKFAAMTYYAQQQNLRR